MIKRWIICILAINKMQSKLFLTTLIFLSLTVLTTLPTFAQKHKVTGEVIDASTNEVVIGANVIVEGTNIGVVTDTYGKFSIDVPNKDSVLLISFLGYLTEKVAVNNAAKVSLTPDIKTLSEVVIVGYGTQKRSDITGSVTSVNQGRLSQLPVTNVMTAIEGAVAGVSVAQTSSVPGSTATVQVRGVNSINASTSPLIILDGIPFEGSLNYINSNDIESMEILKDASSVAIYGARSANGVILITTKKGKSGKPTIKYNVYGGVEDIPHILTPGSPEQYVQKYKDYMTQTGQKQNNPVPNAAELANYNAGKTTDWIKEVTQTGIIQNHNISISGGTENVKYYVSGDYLKEKGVVKGYNYERAGIRSSLEANITEYLSTGVSLFAVSNNYDGGRTNLLFASAMSPYGQLRNATTGKYEIYPMYPELLYTNPMIGLYQNYVDERWNLSGNYFAEFRPTFIKGLKYRFNASYDFNPSRACTYTGRDANNTIGKGEIKNTESKKYLIENIVTYTKDWDVHHLDFTGLYSAQKNNYFESSSTSSSFINDFESYNNLESGATQTAASEANQYTMLSQMGRLNYSYDSRYLFTATARRDGYSAFGSNTNKYGVFPSVALGWNIANEKFMDNIQNYVDKLKLRASYGKSGNMAIGVNQTTSTDETVRMPFNGVSTIGVLAKILGNANLNWESTTGLNVGLDFSLLKSRISGTIEVYKTRTSDLLMKRNIPLVSGYNWVWDNLGVTENKGIELSLNTVNIVTDDFKWESNINYTAFRNEIVDLYGDKKSDVGNKWFIGEPIGVIYDYKMVGIWQKGEDASNWDPSAKPGDIKFADMNGDHKITADDKVIQGSTLPTWTGGITNTFHYKNFHLNVFVQTFQGAKKYNNDLNYSDEQGRRNTPAEIGYWTEENMSNSRPSLAYNNTKGYGFASDNSYTRIKDVTLSYTFSPQMLNATFLSSLTLYVSGRNLYTFTNWVGWDPEMNYSMRGSGDWTTNYPNVRSFVFGMNVALK
jgi:TonB-linked SusC/RagA family outer membrane protein